MKKDKLLVCTFSGGRTSAFMGRLLMELPQYKEYDKVFLFANTGKEKEKTLEFINKCDKEWKLNVVWLEALVNPEKNKGTKHKIVSYKTASRNGEPFVEVVKKYGIPNPFMSICTRELKQRPMDSYIKSLGYKDITTAIGIRYDERHRKSIRAEETNTIYPLCDDVKVDSEFIRNWWDKQTWDLKLKDYEGNCDLCFKKSIRKRLTMIKQNPISAEWWLNVEAKFADEKHPRWDLRSNKSIKELIEMAKQPFKIINDKHDTLKKQTTLFDNVNMDIETDCFCKAT
jgi:3'-phosphoadenosine 5'-phosphosulfate sulfotransferase (PAPS reductase)/FAD synthetase